jgi:hypothetical protein
LSSLSVPWSSGNLRVHADTGAAVLLDGAGGETIWTLFVAVRGGEAAGAERVLVLNGGEVVLRTARPGTKSEPMEHPIGPYTIREVSIEPPKKREGESNAAARKASAAKRARSARAQELKLRKRQLLRNRIRGVWDALVGLHATGRWEPNGPRQRAELYLELPSREELPEYFDVIKKPIALVSGESLQHWVEPYVLTRLPNQPRNCRIGSEPRRRSMRTAPSIALAQMSASCSPTPRSSIWTHP